MKIDIQGTIRKKETLDTHIIVDAIRSYISKSNFPKALIVKNLIQEERLLTERKNQITELIKKGHEEIERVRNYNKKIDDRCTELLFTLKEKLFKD